MKKIVSILTLVILFSITVEAQRGNRGKQREKMTPEQMATLQVKKMTLALDLSNNQQRKIQPLIEEQIKNRQQVMQNRRADRKNEIKITADERFKRANNRLENLIKFQQEVKEILTEEQFVEFKEIQEKRKKKMESRKTKMRRYRRNK